MTRISVQTDSREGGLPDVKEIRRWVRAALGSSGSGASLTVRIADLEECQELNRRWRECNKATNVLAFPSGEVDAKGHTYLGDIVICAPVVHTEARAQGKEAPVHPFEEAGTGEGAGEEVESGREGGGEVERDEPEVGENGATDLEVGARERVLIGRSKGWREPAVEAEDREIRTLAGLGIANPYILER